MALQQQINNKKTGCNLVIIRGLFDFDASQPTAAEQSLPTLTIFQCPCDARIRWFSLDTLVERNHEEFVACVDTQTGDGACGCTAAIQYRQHFVQIVCVGIQLTCVDVKSLNVFAVDDLCTQQKHEKKIREQIVNEEPSTVMWNKNSSNNYNNNDQMVGEDANSIMCEACGNDESMAEKWHESTVCTWTFSASRIQIQTVQLELAP